MFKLLLCTVFIAPCIILPFAGTSAASNEIETVSFDEAYVSPELAKIESCEAAELDVFFHDAYITMHSAEYLAEAISLSDDCGSASFTIAPIVPVSSTDQDREMLQVQTDELVAILDAHNVNAKVAEAEIQSEFDSLSVNGRTAIVKIELNTGQNS